MSPNYQVGYWVAFIPVFLISWGYCIAEYGYLFGVGLGWLPSLIVATLCGALWPVLAILIVVVIWFIATNG